MLKAVAAAAGCAAIVYLMTTEVGSAALLRAVERGNDPPTGREQVVVVLTGNGKRVAAASRFQRSIGLPMVVIGDNAPRTHSQYARALGARVTMVEAGSRNTAQNASKGSCLLKAQGISSVFLFTDASHARRAATWFRHAGIAVTVVTAPTLLRVPSTGNRYLPSGAGVERLHIAAHETLGMVPALLGRLRGPPNCTDGQR